MDPSPLIDLTFKHKQELIRSKYALFWAFVNMVLAFMVYLDMCHGYISSYFRAPVNIIWYSDLFLIVLFTLNAVVDVMAYLKPSLPKTSVELTPKQRRLLAINEADSGFSFISTKISPVTPDSNSKINSIYHNSFTSSTPFNITNSSWMSSASVSSPLSSASSSWVYYPNDSNQSLLGSHPQDVSPFKVSDAQNQYIFDTSMERRNLYKRNKSRLEPSDDSEKIMDEAALHKYLKAYDLKEKKAELSLSETPTSLGASFWNLGPTSLDYSQLLKKYAYQVASRSPQSSTSHNDNDLGSLVHHVGDEIWNKLGVNSEKLYSWMKNLRQWINLTILDRLVNEIRNINDILRRMGSPDLQIGEVSLSTLRQVYLTKSQMIPTLNILLPYLEVTSNQEYLIQRIQELAGGGCMSDYTWNGGGKFKGKPWGDHLPTDAAIVMHLFCAYLDSRLPPHPNYPDGKTFTNQCYIKTPDKPDPTKDTLCFYQTKLNPPHFKLVVKGEVWDLPKGPKNLFHTLLLFLYHIQLKENGMFGRVNFGPSGINVLCILDSD